jgi:predicted kinase
MLTSSNRLPLLIVLVGPIAVGKTSLAKEIHDRLQIPVVSSDEIRHEHFPVPMYDNVESDAVYKVGLERVREKLMAGSHVVFDATNLSELWREQARIMSVGLAELLYILLCPATETMVSRLHERDQFQPINTPRYKNWWEVYQDLSSRTDPLNSICLLVDSAKSFDRVIDLIERLR